MSETITGGDLSLHYDLLGDITKTALLADWHLCLHGVRVDCQPVDDVTLCINDLDGCRFINGLTNTIQADRHLCTHCLLYEGCGSGDRRLPGSECGITCLISSCGLSIKRERQRQRFCAERFQIHGNRSWVLLNDLCETQRHLNFDRHRMLTGTQSR